MYTGEYNLENRLVEFSAKVIDLARNISSSFAGTHLAGQLTRSGSSCALNYGEAKGAESRNDFIHKMRIVLKELRESYVCLKIIERSNLCSESEELIKIKKENNELISIFVISIETAVRNKKP